MVTTLRRKLRRDVRRQRGTFLAVAGLVLLGVALFVAAYDGYRNLQRSYDDLFARTGFADLTVSGGDVEAFAARAAQLEGVAETRVRTVAEVPVTAAGEKLLGRVVGVPAGTQPTVNGVEALQGDATAEPGEVLVEQHLASTLDLAPGDTVTLAGQGATVAGVVASPEYLWPARSRQDVFPDPRGFGVLFAPSFEVAGGPNEALVRFADGADRAALETRLTGSSEARDGRHDLGGLARDLGAAAVVGRAEQPSNAVLSEDIAAFGALAVLFPVLFLSTAGAGVQVLLARRVREERSLIGTLRASGATRGQVVRHYLQYGVAAGLAGGLPGVLVGVLAARVFTQVYASAIDLPSVVTTPTPLATGVGLLFGPAAGALAALGPARTAARLSPAEAMRGIVPARGGGRSLLERLVPVVGRLPVRWRLVLRAPTRHPVRTASTAAGVVLAAVLVITAWGLLDTVNRSLDRQFTEIDRTDARVALTGPTSPGALAALAGTEGVARAEPAAAAEVTLVAGGQRYRTGLEALRPDTALRTFPGEGGDEQALPRDGLLLGAALQERLGLDVGDTVAVLGDDGSSARSTVRGFVAEPLGTPAYTSLRGADALALDAAPTVLLRLDPDADAEAVRDRATGLDVVAGYRSTAALQTLVQEEFAALLYGFIGGMLVLGVLLAAGILFTTLSVSLAERGVEVTTLRASGADFGRLARLLTGETLLVTALGLAPGLLLGWLAARGALASFSSEQFTLELVTTPWLFAVAATGLLGAALIAQLPGLRALRRMQIARVVRERAA